MIQKIKISTPYIELDSFLKFANLVSSGGEAKIVIQSGEVFLNGEVCTQRKKKLYSGDKILLDGREYSVEG